MNLSRNHPLLYVAGKLTAGSRCHFARRDVIGGNIACHIVQRFFFLEVLAGLTNDDAQFAFIVASIVSS
jgi:hypothetical protein